MMDLSSVIDGLLALLGAVTVLTFGMWTLTTESTTVSATSQTQDREFQDLRQAA